MLHWIWVGFRLSHLFFAVLMAAMFGAMAAAVADHLWPRRPALQTGLALAAGLLVASLAIVWLATSDGRPVRVVVLEREGERRVAVVSLMQGSKGGSTCFVGTWTLPGGRKVGRTALPYGDCSPASGTAEILWLDERRGWLFWRTRNPVAVDLWTGRPRLDVLSALGPLPGNGEVKIHRPLEDSVQVDLQDGTTRTVRVAPLEPPVSSHFMEKTRQPVEIPGLFQAQALGGDCGCAPSCGTLVLHSSVAFGEGERLLSLVREGKPAWTEPADDLIGGELLGTIGVGGECVAVGSGWWSTALVWLDPQTGQVERRLSL